MKTVITSAQMRNLDKRTSEEFGIPSQILMENAGKGCADLLFASLSDMLKQGTVILCGHGNNGGDGYVIARWLAVYNIPIHIIKVGNGKSSPETLANLELCRKIPYIQFVELSDENFAEFHDTVLVAAGVIIDAIFGIGFKGKLEEEIADLIEDINLIPAMKVAIDIPSGLDADTGFAELAFYADLTLTMESLKFGHLLGEGKKYCGFTDVVPIGIPYAAWKDETVAIILDEDTVHLPIRDKYAHKGDYGKIAVFAGSPGLTGAAFMASLAALKSGAGLVTIFCHPADMLYYNSKPYEVMVKAVPLKSDQKINADELDALLRGIDVVLFGPGCGVSDYSYQLLEYFVTQWNKPAVIDADGLNTLSQHQDLISKIADKPFILTPHWGEFCRLAKLDMDILQKDCLTPLKAFVENNGLKVLLKSHTSIYYDAEIMYINPTGNDGLATGGSGDVLSGLIAGFLAQKMCLAEAAGMAAYYLGKTAELLAEMQETFSILPTDILDNIFIIDLAQNDDEQ